MRVKFLPGKKLYCLHFLALLHPRAQVRMCLDMKQGISICGEQGVDEIYCLSVNDAFTMFQWGKHLGIENVKLLPDGSGDFTRLMGMLVKKDNVGFGMRSWRYSMLVEDGKIIKQFSEAGRTDDASSDPFEVSDADTMLEYLTA